MTQKQQNGMIIGTLIVGALFIASLSHGSDASSPSPATSTATAQAVAMPTIDDPALAVQIDIGFNRYKQSGLFANDDDVAWQKRAMVEDHADPPGIVQHDSDLIPKTMLQVEYESIERRSPACRLGKEAHFNPSGNYGELVDCEFYGPEGYVFVITDLTRGLKAQRVTDEVGHAWAATFRRFHPKNPHCALLIVLDDGNLAGENDPQYDSEKIRSSHCYPH